MSLSTLTGHAAFVLSPDVSRLNTQSSRRCFSAQPSSGHQLTQSPCPATVLTKAPCFLPDFPSPFPSITGSSQPDRASSCLRAFALVVPLPAVIQIPAHSHVPLGKRQNLSEAIVFMSLRQ